MKIKQSLDEKVYEILLDFILQEKFKAGVRLVPNDISSELGISRTPITLALKRLEQEGLITATSGGKYFIPLVHKKDINEIYDARIMVERQAIKAFIKNVDNEKVKKLKNIVKKYYNFVKEDDIENSVRQDLKFHFCLVKSINNSRIERFFDLLQKQLIIYKYIGTRNHYQLDKAASEHLNIVEFIDAQEEQKALALMEKHIEFSRGQTLQMVNKDAVENDFTPI